MLVCTLAHQPALALPGWFIDVFVDLFLFLTDCIASLCFGVDFRNASEVDGTAALATASRRSASPLDEHSNSEVCG